MSIPKFCTSKYTVSSKRICHMLVGGGGSDPPPYTPTRLFTPKKLIFSLWNKVFWLSFASLWEVLGLSSLEKLIQKNLFHKEKICFSVVKSLVGCGVRTPAPTSKWQISAVAMFAVYRIRCYLSPKLSPNVFGENIKHKKSNIWHQRPKNFKNLKTHKIFETHKIFKFLRKNFQNFLES